jgi:hypothetical protein
MQEFKKYGFRDHETAPKPREVSGTELNAWKKNGMKLSHLAMRCRVSIDPFGCVRNKVQIFPTYCRRSPMLGPEFGDSRELRCITQEIEKAFRKYMPKHPLKVSRRHVLNR